MKPGCPTLNPDVYMFARQALTGGLGRHLATAEELIIEDAELRHILTTIAKRSAGGRAASGRYNKHDTARLRYIRSIAFRFGKRVPQPDMTMLRLGPKHSLRGADLAAMDEWAQRHG
mgnify:FL=1